MNNKLFHKDFTLVVIGQIISLFGNGIIRFALPLYLLSVTGSAGVFGIVSAISFLPMIILTPLGGIIADRVNKRNVMVILDFLTAILILIFSLLLGKVNLIVLFTITLILLFGIQSVYQPTVQASIPILATKDNLLSANAIINQVNALSNLLAPIIGGLLFSTWGLNPILLVGIICFFISAVMEMLIKIPHTKSEKENSILTIAKQDFSESIIFMKKDKPVILKSIGIICLFNLFLSAMLLISMPVIITQTLSMSDKYYGFAQGVIGAGALFGGILIGVFAKKFKVQNIYLLLLFASLFLLPIGISLMLNIPSFICYLIICVSYFCLMSVGSIISIQLFTFIQGETPTHLIGKVISCVMAFAMCAQPIGQAIYGMLFEKFSESQYLIIFGTVIVSSIIALMSKKVFSNMQTNIVN